MSKRELFRRYFLFFVSVLINAFSVALITKALLGTSPISSIPYVLSLFTPLTMGQYTIYMSLVLILMQMTMMTRQEIIEKKFDLINQIPVCIVFGLFIDISMNVLLSWLSPELYLLKLLSLLVGCFLLGLGISLEVKADVTMVTGEYLVHVISKFTNKEFGFVKVCFDVSLVVIACILSLCFMDGIQGVREGTVAAALLVGPVSHFVYPYWRVLDGWLYDKAEAVETADTEAHPVVITITREYGSGGHQLGEMLAKRLGIKFYDKSIISMAAKESRYSEQYISENEQRMSSNYLMNIILRDYGAPIEKGLSPSDAIFVAQSRVIRKIAKEESCVIIGRCGDYILKDIPSSSLIKVFCYSDVDDAAKRGVAEYNLDPKTAKTEIESVNRQRINHYQYYTSQKWGEPHNYNIMINTGSMGFETACELVAKIYDEKKAVEEKH
ncbi:MAG: cytidylate kinase family protein [Prevotellaceae bacterium]|nr:cytidylate kinase family protein [Prevotellaceae bacterium]